VQRFTGESASVNVEVVRAKLHCALCSSGPEALIYGVVPVAVIVGAEPLSASAGDVAVPVKVGLAIGAHPVQAAKTFAADAIEGTPVVVVL
jgi:hypothetical protein